MNGPVYIQMPFASAKKYLRQFRKVHSVSKIYYFI